MMGQSAGALATSDAGAQNFTTKQNRANNKNGVVGNKGTGTPIQTQRQSDVTKHEPQSPSHNEFKVPVGTECLSSATNKRTEDSHCQHHKQAMMPGHMPDWYISTLALAIVLVIIGFWILIKGADYLVEGGVVIARRFQLSLAVIGATIVAFGTSLPELVVSVGSSVKAVNSGQGGVADGPAAIAIANIVGSNIFNIGAILGISALICRLEVSPSTKRLDYPLMLGVFVLFIVFCLPLGDSGFVNRIEGGILVAGLLLFAFLAIKGGKVDADEIPETDGDNMPKAIGFIILGIVMLMLGGDASLNGAISLAESLGMSNRLIGSHRHSHWHLIAQVVTVFKLLAKATLKWPSPMSLVQTCLMCCRLSASVP